MKNEIDGVLSHLPDQKTTNKYRVIGPHSIDGLRWLDRDLVLFRMVKESDSEQMLEELDRIESAVVEWMNDEVEGLLHLRMVPPRTAADAKADALRGGRERSLKVQDLERDLTKDKDIPQNRPDACPRLGYKDEIPFPSPGASRLDEGLDFDD